MNAGWPWLDQGMIDDLNGKPYRDGPALKRGDKVAFQTEDGKILYGYLGDEVTHEGTGVVTMTFSREPVTPLEPARELPQWFKNQLVDMEDWQADLVRKMLENEFKIRPNLLSVGRMNGRATARRRTQELIELYGRLKGVPSIYRMPDAPLKLEPVLKAMPKPSTVLPMWANNPTRSRRPRKNRGQPNRQGIA